MNFPGAPVKPLRPTPGPHASPDPLEVEIPQLAHPPVQTATSMDVGGPVGDICLDHEEDPVDLGTTPTGLREAQMRLRDYHRKREKLNLWLATEAGLRTLLAVLTKELEWLDAELSRTPPEERAKIHLWIGLAKRQLSRCQALLARLSRP